MLKSCGRNRCAFRENASLAYRGIDKADLQDFVLRNRLTGLDRIIPFGETTAFALTWNGFYLIDTMSRDCSML